MNFWLGIGVVAITALSAQNSFAADKKLLDKGKALFTQNCETCHGPKGDGNGPAGQALNPKPRNFATEAFKNGDKPDQVFKTISEGLPGTSMVGYGHLPEADRKALAQYVLSFRKKK